MMHYLKSSYPLRDVSCDENAFALVMMRVLRKLARPLAALIRFWSIVALPRCMGFYNLKFEASYFASRQLPPAMEIIPLMKIGHSTNRMSRPNLHRKGEAYRHLIFRPDHQSNMAEIRIIYILYHLHSLKLKELIKSKVYFPIRRKII